MPRHDSLPQAGRWTDKHVHEGHDTDVRRVTVIGFSLALMVVVAGLVAAMVMSMMYTPPYQSQPRLPVPVPHLQAAPLKDIAALRQEKEAMLRGYSWVDRKQGIVHIPLGLAMDKLAKTPMGLTPNGEEEGQ